MLSELGRLPTILIVEDEPLVRKLMREILAGYHLLEASSFVEAHEVISQDHTGVDLLVADVALPVRAGIHAAADVMARIPDVKVILTSGIPPAMWTSRQNEVFAPLTRANFAFVQKPFTMWSLLDEVQKLIGPPGKNQPRA